jgi:SAM-dependent methyltransferase
MDFKQIVKDGYDTIAKRYLDGRTQDSEDVRLLGDVIRKLPRHAKVLDAGCGAGVPITQILSERFDVIGVDLSETQIELAKKNVPEAAFLCKDMTQLDFPDNTFDGICSYYAIIHIPRGEHHSLFENFYRMLKPNGYALLCLGAENLIDDIEEDFFGARMYWSHFDAESYSKMLKETGFSIIWSKRVADVTCEGGSHLFVLTQKVQL